MSPADIDAFHLAARDYLTGTEEERRAAGERLMPLLLRLMESENARAFIYAGWYFVPYPLENGNWRLYVFPGIRSSGVTQIGTATRAP